jgi:hypothetical protein
MADIPAQRIGSLPHVNRVLPLVRDRRAIGARKLAEDIVEGVVFLHDDEYVLDGVAVISATAERRTDRRAGLGRPLQERDAGRGGRDSDGDADSDMGHEVLGLRF